jgi:hypothetical protein
VCVCVCAFVCSSQSFTRHIKLWMAQGCVGVGVGECVCVCVCVCVPVRIPGLGSCVCIEAREASNSINIHMCVREFLLYMFIYKFLDSRFNTIYMYIYVYIHTYTYIYIYIYIYIYVCIGLASHRFPPLRYKKQNPRFDY